MTSPFSPLPIEPRVITATPAIEPPMIPTLQDFMALARTKNFSRTDRFLVNFALPIGLMDEFGQEVTNLTLLCEEAAFPGKIITPRPFRTNGLTEHRAHTADYMGDQITFQFLVDSTWMPRRVFERWSELCVGSIDESREVGFYQDYVSNISIFALVPATPELDGVSKALTPSDRGARTGLGTEASIAQNIADRLKRIGNDQLDRLKTKAGSYIDPKATDLLKNTQRILNKYVGGVDPNQDLPAEKAVWGMQLFEAWPRIINVQQVAYNSPGFHKLNVTFTFKYWQSDAVAKANNERQSKANRTSVLDRLSLDKLFPRVSR